MKLTDITSPCVLNESTHSPAETLTESSKITKLRQYIYGLKDVGAGIVIATAQNPLGGDESAKAYDGMSAAEKQAYDHKNRQLLDFGESYIRDVLNKRYFKQVGVFGGQKEKSFVIVDMSRDDAVMLGRKWKQTAVIHISVEERNGRKQLAFRMINTTDEQGYVESLVRSLTTAPANQDDYYSKIGSTKFIIPFYDTEAEWKAAFGRDSTPGAKRKAGKDRGVVMFRDKTGRFILPKAA